MKFKLPFLNKLFFSSNYFFELLAAIWNTAFLHELSNLTRFIEKKKERKKEKYFSFESKAY